MTSKERLDIIKQRVNTIRLNTKIGSRTFRILTEKLSVADKENTVLLDHIEYNLNEIYKIVERDTPKKVEIGTSKNFKFPICPNCKVELNEYYKNRYCKECGQRLDWSGILIPELKKRFKESEKKEKLLELYKEYFEYSEMLKDGRKFGGKMLVEHERDKIIEEIKELENEKIEKDNF